MPTLNLTLTLEQFNRFSVACRVLFNRGPKEQIVWYMKEVVRTHERLEAEKAATANLPPEIEVT